MSKSENLYHAARELIPGGVNSPVRALPASAAHRYLSNARMALTSMTWMGKPISIMSVPGVRWCWATTTRLSAMR